MADHLRNAANMRQASITSSKRQLYIRQSSMASRSRGHEFRNNSRRVGGTSISNLGNSRIGGSRFAGARGSLLAKGGPKLQDQSKLLGVQVFNEDNEDVTPTSLITGKHIDTNIETTEANTDDQNINSSMFGGGNDIFSSIGPFTRSIVADDNNQDKGDAGHDYNEGHRETVQAAAALFRVKPRERSAGVLTEKEEHEIININIQETETIWMFELKGTCVPSNDPTAGEVLKRNEEKSVFNLSGRKDMYTSQAVQTYSNGQKHKDTQCNVTRTRATGTQSYGWDIHDTYERGAEEEEHRKAKEDHARRRELAMQKFEAAIAAGTEYDATESLPSSSTSMSKSIYMSIMKGSETDVGDKGHNDENMEAISEAATRVANEHLHEKILRSEELIQALSISELMAAQNVYHDKQSAYRKVQTSDSITVPPVSSPAGISNHEGATTTSKPRVKSARRGNDVGDKGARENGATSILDSRRPAVSPLWSYTLDAVSHLSVTGVAWNKRNPDIIAVAYGQTDFTKQSDGYCLCWSLKNPKYPERIYKFSCGVTAVDFCCTEPHLVALGLYDGSVCVYNVRNKENKSVMDSIESGGTHQAPVWQLQWVNRDEISGDERGEILASISTDGRVTQWQINKGLTHVDLMCLKPVGTKPGSSAEGSAFMCRQVGGTCFDFSNHDSSIYVAATEEGHIHKCSSSYNEQYLNTYNGHSAPVYKVKLSPFSKNIFLSCSADWSIRLWSLDKDETALKIQTALSPIVDICWSPTNSTVFGSVCEGRMEVWDLSQSTIDPVIKKHISDNDLTCVTFAPNSNAILVGDNSGGVHVQLLQHVAVSTDGNTLDDVVAAL